jgi:predicted nucleic acid-binding Zn ribbon protein
MAKAKEEERSCMQCGDKLFGRRDQKYCSDQCRVEYNNLLNRDVSKFMTNINNLLRKNRRILEKMNPHGKSKVTKAQLLDEGFNFNYFTNEYVTKAGKAYKFVYDQGYLELEEGIYALVQKHEYVGK